MHLLKELADQDLHDRRIILKDKADRIRLDLIKLSNEQKANSSELCKVADEINRRVDEMKDTIQKEFLEATKNQSLPRPRLSFQELHARLEKRLPALYHRS